MSIPTEDAEQRVVGGAEPRGRLVDLGSGTHLLAWWVEPGENGHLGGSGSGGADGGQAHVPEVEGVDGRVEACFGVGGENALRDGLQFGRRAAS